MLKRKTAGLNAVVVDLVQIHLRWRIVNIVLVRGIARPVSPRRIDFYHHQLVSRECGRDHVDDLPRGVSATAETGRDIARSNQPGLQLCTRGYPAFGNLARGLGLK